MKFERVKFKPIRSKYWKYGEYHLLPDVGFIWNKDMFTFYIGWLAYRLVFVFDKEITEV